MAEAVDERFSLRVRNLPAVLSTEAITSLLSHYGATRVRVLQRRVRMSSGKEPGVMTSKKLQKAVAIFATREAQQNAQKHLHSLELAGHYLQVEVVGDEAVTTSIEAKPEAGVTGNNVSLSDQPPLPKGLPPPLPSPAPQNSLYIPAPLAPHLGYDDVVGIRELKVSMLTVAMLCDSLNYAPSPLLEYKYPKATESINKLSSIKHNSALNMAFQLGTNATKHQEEQRSSRPGVISENEVNQQRVTPEGTSVS
ncbi:Hypothetical protein PHPALM_17610 [Phytophthora palmivora]|uniref:Uncharacterized protein n=1 Tax=Phytophthora palmivora TaxID=4796 RepID=A0A2P4XLT4_9STRA|nr:Hypothetical protein PHPALM_17610 [Phytophthora palmivora]